MAPRTPAAKPRTAAKSPTKTTPKAAPRPAAKKTTPAPAKPVAVKVPAPAPAPKAAAPAKPPKIKAKLVRDSFTMPKTEYAVIDDLKTRAAKLAMPVKKSELLRAGIKALAAMNDAAFAAALGNVPTIKTGRPKG